MSTTHRKYRRYASRNYGAVLVRSNSLRRNAAWRAAKRKRRERRA